LNAKHSHQLQGYFAPEMNHCRGCSLHKIYIDTPMWESTGGIKLVKSMGPPSPEVYSNSLRLTRR